MSLLLVLGALEPVPLAVAFLPRARTETLVRAQTAIRLITTVDLSSRGLVQGQRVPLQVKEDVVVGGQVVIAAGTAAVGEIEALSEKGMFGKAAKFTLQPLFIDLEGRRINLAGRHRESGQEATAAAAVTTVLTGGLGLIITGKSARLPAGREVVGELRNDVALP